MDQPCPLNPNGPAADAADQVVECYAVLVEAKISIEHGYGCIDSLSPQRGVGDIRNTADIRIGRRSADKAIQCNDSRDRPRLVDSRDLREVEFAIDRQIQRRSTHESDRTFQRDARTVLSIERYLFGQREPVCIEAEGEWLRSREGIAADLRAQ